MTGHVRYTALLDACVLYPIVTADALMSLTAAGLFAAKWTRRIENEWISNLEADRPDLKDRLDRRRDTMRKAVPDWEVTASAWQAIQIRLKLPDPDDEHVIAAAVAGHADCIVTANIKDFPNSITAPLGLEAVHPDPFIIAQWDLDPIATIHAFKQMRARWRHPNASAVEFADRFERAAMPLVGSRLRQAAELI